MMTICPRANRARVSDLDAHLIKALTSGYAQPEMSERAAKIVCACVREAPDLRLRARARTSRKDWSRCRAQSVCVYEVHTLRERRKVR